MALKRSRNCLPFARTTSATSMAGRIMGDADDDRSDGSGRRWTASALRSGWQPGAGAARISADTGPSLPDPHGRAETGWCAGRCRLQAGVWPNCGESDGACGLTNAWPFCRFAACQPHYLVRDRLLMLAMATGWKQVGAWLEPAPVGAQSLQQCRTERQVAILPALAVHHVDNHALAVDVGYLQPGNLGAAHARAVENHQQCALEQAAAGVDQTRDFFLAQDVGQFPLHLGIGQKLAEPGALQGPDVEEAQGGNVVLHGAWRQLAHLQQVGLIGAQLVGAKLIG